tara:strand:+ start:5640 stop:5948 length:309 start_codon:yes stop_codon:yes gene_type:complete
MKKTILTTLTAIALLTSCTKEDDLNPILTPCTDTDGVIIEVYTSEHNPTNNDWNYTYLSELTIATSCDTVEAVRYHAIETVDYGHSMEIITYNVGDSFTVIR